MIFKLSLIFLFKIVILNGNKYDKLENIKIEKDLIIDLTDEKWDVIQKGQWLVGFFNSETEEGRLLEKHWQLIAHKCKDLNIEVGRVFPSQNPGLYVRFLVTVFPKVFYIKNGVAHEIRKVNKDSVMQFINDQTWSKLKPVNFLRNPFSVQMSLLSNLFIHAVNLYNFEHYMVQKFVSAKSATDVAFCLTFIIVGTFLGLVMTCAFGILKIFLMDSKESERGSDDEHSDDDEEEEDEKKNEEKEEEKSNEKSKEVRKRK